MNKTIHYILQELEGQLSYLSSDEALLQVNRAIDQLQGYMRLYVLKDIGEEILYFKIFKPRFMAHRLCAEYAIKNMSETLWEERTVEQQSFYNYYTTGQSHRDRFYFTSKQCKELDFEMPELAGHLWHGYDKWVARILASEWVRKN